MLSSPFYDLSRSANLHNDKDQSQCFHIPKAKAEPLSFNGHVVGDINQGNNVNCEVISICPHGSSTHTECIGHITPEKSYIPSVEPLMKAILITVPLKQIKDCSDTYPATHNDTDEVICLNSLQNELQDKNLSDINAIIIRTKISNLDKYINFSGTNAPYFTPCAMEYIVENNIKHLLVDLPSVDKEDDEGYLASHSIFFGLPIRKLENGKTIPVSDKQVHETRKSTTITELCYIPDTISDGYYILNLQIPPLLLDAVPSRPIIFPL